MTILTRRFETHQRTWLLVGCFDVFAEGAGHGIADREYNFYVLSGMVVFPHRSLLVLLACRLSPSMLLQVCGDARKRIGQIEQADLSVTIAVHGPAVIAGGQELRNAECASVRPHKPGNILSVIKSYGEQGAQFLIGPFRFSFELQGL